LVYNKILSAKKNGEKLLAILLDPDKLNLLEVAILVKKINKHQVHFIFVGGSTVKNDVTEKIVEKIKQYTKIPIVLFPGNCNQITNQADAILFLSLLSGRNPEYLIEQQIKSVPFLQNTALEIIPTAYILIDGGTKTTVQKVSNTTALSQKNMDKIVNTACAGMYMGNKLIYLEAGSGAKNTVQTEIIKSVKEKTTIPIIVGGGIKTKKQMLEIYKSGADLIVIGTAFEKNNNLLAQL